jgi:Uma2 family endonuclease
MTTLAAPVPVTYTPFDVSRLSDQEGKLYELVGGRLVEKHVSTISNLVSGELLFRLKSHYPNSRACVFPEQPTYCFGDPTHGRRPDVALVWAHRLAQADPDDELYIAPDFVAEVVSPTNGYNEIRGRVNEFLGAGVPLVWVVEPEFRSIQAYRGDGSVALCPAHATIANEPALPGFSLVVGDLFPPPRPGVSPAPAQQS